MPMHPQITSTQHWFRQIYSSGTRKTRLISAAVIDAVKRRTPTALYPLARTVLHRVVVPVECWGVAVADRVLRRRYDGRVLPPARLRYKVRGSASGDAFARIGRACATDIDAALRSCGHSVAQSRRILDFGCGCGGTLLWLTDLAPTASISGTDIDASAIEWCGANIPFAKFAVNGALPPLAYADASFDLVYAVSVFTHLDEDYETPLAGRTRTNHRTGRRVRGHAGRPGIMERNARGRSPDARRSRFRLHQR